jgi:hypothetical protein
LRPTRQASRGKLLTRSPAARSHDFNFVSEDVHSPPPLLRRQQNTSLSLPFLHGQRLQTQ